MPRARACWRSISAKSSGLSALKSLKTRRSFGCFFAAPTSQGDEEVVGLSRLGAGNGIDGSGVLCYLEFQVVGPGDANLAFSREKVRDSHNRIVSSVFGSATVAAR